MRHLKESNEFQPKLRSITSAEKDYLTKFVELVEMTFAFSKEKKHSQEHIDKFLQNAKPYLKYAFSENIGKYVDYMENHNAKKKSLKADEKGFSNFLTQHEQIVKALKNNNTDEALKLNKKRRSFVEAHDIINNDISNVSKNKFYNPYKFESNFMFNNKDAFTSNFSENDIPKLREILNSKELFTTSSRDLTDVDTADTLIWTILHKIKRSKEGKYEGDIRDFVKFNYEKDPNFKKIMLLANAMLYDNKKENIDEILTLLKTLPLLEAANKKLAKEIKQVYRGVSVMSDDRALTKKEVIEHDKKQKFVSTSSSTRSASNFALGKGHLDAQRRSKYGYLVTYNVDEKSIILCMEIFGSVYGEREILIDAKKATIEKIEKI